ncbi:MAG: carboxypeptidase-like regulatory domain-containing protein [Nannocystales bacterium]
MRRLALLALVTCACGVPKTVSVSPATSHSVLPEAKITYDTRATGAVKGHVRHQSTDAPLGNAVVLLRSNDTPDLEMTTDAYGRYSFEGLPPSTYTLQVLVGQADVAKVFALPDSARFRANFLVDPEQPFVCRLPSVQHSPMDQSLFSVTNESETRLLQQPVTRYGL